MASESANFLHILGIPDINRVERKPMCRDQLMRIHRVGHIAYLGARLDSLYAFLLVCVPDFYALVC